MEKEIFKCPKCFSGTFDLTTHECSKPEQRKKFEYYHDGEFEGVWCYCAICDEAQIRKLKRERVVCDRCKRLRVKERLEMYRQKTAR